MTICFPLLCVPSGQKHVPSTWSRGGGFLSLCPSFLSFSLQLLSTPLVWEGLAQPGLRDSSNRAELSSQIRLPVWQAGPGQPKAKSSWDRDLVPRNDSCSGAAPRVCPWDWQRRMVTHFLAAPQLEQSCHRALWTIQRGHAVQTMLWKVTPRGYHRERSCVGQGVRWG